MEDLDRIIQLRRQGFYCSQILIQMGLDLQGKTNPDLVRSMHALANGISSNGEICGGLTGSCCLLGLYAGKGEPDESEDERLQWMVSGFLTWFGDEYGQKYGGIRCEEILAGNYQNKMTRCPDIVAGSFQKVKELLVENGFDLSGVQ